MAKKTTNNKQRVEPKNKPTVKDDQAGKPEDDDGEVDPAATEKAFADELGTIETEEEADGGPLKFDPEANDEPEEIAKKEAQMVTVPTRKAVRPAIFGLGVLSGIIIAMIIFGIYYYMVGQEVCDSYNSVTNSEKKLTSLITSQNNRETKISDACPTVLTETDNLEIANWKTYKNEKSGLSFLIPADWQESKPATTNQFFFKAPGDVAATLNVGIGEAASITTVDGYILKTTSTEKVACNAAKVKTYVDSNQNEANRIKTATFTASSTPYLFEYAWQTNMGASVSSDYSDLFDLILKTVSITKV